MKTDLKITPDPSEVFAKYYHEAEPVFKKATQDAVNYVHQEVPPYPGKSSGPYPWKSERQRRYVMAMMSQRGPYRRTGQLGRSITTRVEKTSGMGNWVGLIGTNTVYAPWVISGERIGSQGPQAAIHGGNWWTLQQVVHDAFDGVVKIYEKAIKGWVSTKSL